MRRPVTCNPNKGFRSTRTYLPIMGLPIYRLKSLVGTLRLHLMEVLKEQGVHGIKELTKQMKRDRRDRPKTVLKLNKSVYGIPGAEQAFSMFLQGLHKQKCGLKQSEMDPCIFFKINKDENTNAVTGYLVAITWVDDCRYFGTDDLVGEYKKVLVENCKCTLE
jgi:hypothetical protein